MRVPPGRGAFWTLCVLLLAGNAAAQTYPTMTSPTGYGDSAPAVRQAGHLDSTPPQVLEPVYGGSTDYYGPQEQSPVQARDPYQSAMNDNWDDCGPCCPPPRWFGSAGAVFLNRSDRDFDLSFPPCDAAPLTYNSAGMPTTMGPSLTLGRYLGCNGCFGVQFVYWGLYPTNQTSDLYATSASGPLVSTFNWSGLGYNSNGADLPVASVFDSAARLQLQRQLEITNIEINVLSFSSPYGNGCGSPYGPGACDAGGSSFRYSLLAGFRYLNFRENMLFSADRDDTVWGNSEDELHYYAEVKNRLAGFQVGGRADYFITPSLSAFATAKGGVYGNDMAMRQYIYNQNGYAFSTAPSNYGSPFDLYGQKTGVSFLGEFSVGGNWRITKCWSAYAGYMVMAATGVAELNNQIPTQFYELQDNSTIKSNGTLLLHGAYAGLSYNF